MELNEMEELARDKGVEFVRFGREFILAGGDGYEEKISSYALKNMDEDEFMVKVNRVASTVRKPTGRRCLNCNDVIWSNDEDADEDFCGSCA